MLLYGPCGSGRTLLLLFLLYIWLFVIMCALSLSQCKHLLLPCRGVRLAKNDFCSVFGSVLQKTAVFGSVSVLQN